MKRTYYGERHGERPKQIDSFGTIGLAFKIQDLLKELRTAGYLRYAEGERCGGRRTSAEMGDNPAAYAKKRIGTEWPPSEHRTYSQFELFDLIEFTFDLVAKPVDTAYCPRCGGRHLRQADRSAAQRAYRAAVNGLLEHYERGGWELSEAGEMLAAPPLGLQPLFEAPASAPDPSVERRVGGAIAHFQKHHASSDDRRRAVRELADVLEKLRPVAKQHLASKDEQDLFELANRYGIRHFRDDQKADYDLEVWVDWQFFYYLATVRCLQAIIERASETSDRGAKSNKRIQPDSAQDG